MRSAAESSERDASNGTASAVELNSDTIRAALDKILSSPGFANAERLSRFLRYTVEETLGGQTDKLKESLLGIEVFGRKPTYDPRVDAVVRTEAVKLRARLRDYYESEGREDQIIIDVPKGGYVPAFRQREKEAPSEPAPAPEPTSPPVSGRDWRPAVAALLVLGLLGISIYALLRGRVRTPDPRGAELSSIAVLPFADLSPARDQEYFCDGMTEEIIDELTRIPGIRVVARTSSFAFKGKQQDIREIGRKLNVAAVLEGSVRKDGNRLRITAQLNSVADGYHLWSETYERELKDVFTVQDEISRAIVNTLQLKLSSRERPNTSSPENVEAYELYLRGRYHWSKWRSEGAEQALHYFEEAIAKDPQYAPAYAGIAYSYTWLGFFGAMLPAQAMPKAKEAAEKALSLDDSLAAAHTALAYVKALYEFDWPGAEREFKRALQLNAGDADAHFGYAIGYLSPQGRYQESVHEMEIARDLDPLSPVEVNYLGLAYQLVGKRAEALAQYNRALEIEPNFIESRLHLANFYLDQLKFKEYYAELDRALAIAADTRIEPMRAFGLAIQGKKAEALELIEKCEKPGPGGYVQSTYIASVYAMLGDKEHMFAWLDKAYADRDGMVVFSMKNSCYRPYRSDPRFVALMQKLGLPAVYH